MTPVWVMFSQTWCILGQTTYTLFLSPGLLCIWNQLYNQLFPYRVYYSISLSPCAIEENFLYHYEVSCPIAF
jgi:hypothetical protein